ncbi:hypothetical protein SAMN05216490_3397 [Mucilaginibacter mallensis]|uniref:Uncharacterized protein n=1 Tax=Mucilaginibacter mallensis TaxID=652787 RepID=A0A1H2A6A7_MUCMA|nr:hypothetical protein SAMN05216490_3397 [Mucilaginibacter mallensis]
MCNTLSPFCICLLFMVAFFSPSVIARNEAIPDCAERDCFSYTCLMVSLVAKTSLFVLIQKVTKKIKTTRMLLRSLPVLHAFFAVRHIRAFTSHKKLNRHSRLYAGPPLLSGPMLFLFFFLSVEQLRAKSGKTMVALCVAGHSRFLLKRKGQVSSDSRVKI